MFQHQMITAEAKKEGKASRLRKRVKLRLRKRVKRTDERKKPPSHRSLPGELLVKTGYLPFSH